jgi:cellulose synthase operon protein C
LEERIVAAKNYVKANEKDSALNLYKQNYSMDENDTTTIYKIVNLYLDDKNTDSAMVYINTGLNQNPENGQLLLKKSIAFEIDRNFDSSFYYMSKLIPQRNNSYQNYADYLYSKTLKRQGGFLYLRTTFDTNKAGNSLASFQYTRFKVKNTYTYRINYAARNNGTAMQHEFDWNHKMDSLTYSEANIGIASKEVFPYFKISGSIFKTLRKNYEGEVGLKYIKLKDAGFATLIGGLSKTYNEIWINGRVFILSDGKALYNSGRLSARLYMNERTEYLTAMVGYGTAPDDKSLDFILNKFVGVVSRYVGAGYQKEFRYRTTLGITGTWNNIRQFETSYSNQYNLFLTVLRKF